MVLPLFGAWGNRKLQINGMSIIQL